MAKEPSAEFDAGAYWQDRVVSGSDLGVVGHRSMGLAYNAQIYERRMEVLDDMLERHISKPVADLRILDIGCGSGFYTGYWAERGVRDYVGVDISAATVSHLCEQYPDFSFINADITETEIEGIAGQEPFDLVTIFDVFYHIVDDARFSNAVRHIGTLTANAGVVLVMDQLHPVRYQLSKHVVYRDRDEYVALFDRSGLALLESELLFHYLVPPMSGYRLVDLAAAGIFKLAGFVVRVSDRLASSVAVRLRRFDNRLRSSGRRVSNSEMLVFGKGEG
jgi:2-polyprenyl-3-methyl-5-hydroxy-6-metoxy-1,4-benzoquinol methylase